MLTPLKNLRPTLGLLILGFMASTQHGTLLSWTHSHKGNSQMAPQSYQGKQSFPYAQKHAGSRLTPPPHGSTKPPITPPTPSGPTSDNLTVLGNLVVDGTTTCKKTLDVAGVVTASGGLNATNGLNVTKGIVTDTFTSNGVVTMRAGETVTGGISADTLKTSGAATLHSLSVTGAATIGGSLTATNGATFNGVTADTIMTDELEVHDELSIDGITFIRPSEDFKPVMRQNEDFEPLHVFLLQPVIDLSTTTSTQVLFVGIGNDNNNGSESFFEATAYVRMIYHGLWNGNQVTYKGEYLVTARPEDCKIINETTLHAGAGNNTDALTASFTFNTIGFGDNDVPYVRIALLPTLKTGDDFITDGLLYYEIDSAAIFDVIVNNVT